MNETIWLMLFGMGMFNLIMLFCLIATMRKVGKLDERTQPLTSYTEHDQMMRTFRVDRRLDEEQWRHERGIPNVPEAIEGLLAREGGLRPHVTQQDLDVIEAAVWVDPSKPKPIRNADDPLEELGKLIGRTDPRKG